VILFSFSHVKVCLIYSSSVSVKITLTNIIACEVLATDFSIEDAVFELFCAALCLKAVCSHAFTLPVCLVFVFICVYYVCVFVSYCIVVVLL